MPQCVRRLDGQSPVGGAVRSGIWTLIETWSSPSGGVVGGVVAGLVGLGVGVGSTGGVVGGDVGVLVTLGVGVGVGVGWPGTGPLHPRGLRRTAGPWP